MILRILETPLLDVLLLILLLRIVFPSLFRRRSKPKKRIQDEQTIFTSSRNPKSKQEEGDYIDYEEIK